MACETGCVAKSFDKEYTDGKITIRVGCRSDFANPETECKKYLDENCPGASIYSKNYNSFNTVWLYATCQE